MAIRAGIQCQLDPVITMFVTPKSRALYPAQAPFSHLQPKPIVLGMAGVSRRAVSVTDILSVLVEEMKAILRTEEVSTSAQLVTLGLDSLGFVSITSNDCGDVAL